MLATIAGWIAPAATIVGAIATAINLGTRVTGWGFVIFSVGAVAWIVDAIAKGETNLLLANTCLRGGDLIGVWRGLGRQARYDEGSRSAAAASRAAPAPTLFPISKLEGRPVQANDGHAIGTAVEAMAACEDGRIAYLVVRTGGVGSIGETLHAVGWDEVNVHDAALTTRLSAGALTERPPLSADRWPESAEAAGVG